LLTYLLGYCVDVQIYYASEEFGVDDIRTSGGYFHMAQVFDLQANVLVARSLYDQVTSINQSINQNSFV